MIREPCSITTPANISNSILFACGRGSLPIAYSVHTHAPRHARTHTHTAGGGFIYFCLFMFLPPHSRSCLSVSLSLPSGSARVSAPCNRVRKQGVMLTQCSAAVMPARRSIFFFLTQKEGQLIFTRKKEKMQNADSRVISFVLSIILGDLCDHRLPWQRAHSLMVWLWSSNFWPRWLHNHNSCLTTAARI